MTTMASKEEIIVFERNSKVLNVLFDQLFQKITSILLLQINLSNKWPSLKSVESKL